MGHLLDVEDLPKRNEMGNAHSGVHRSQPSHEW